MTMTGAVEMTGAFPRVWSESTQPLTRRLAVVQAPVAGTTLPISGLGHVNQAAQGIAITAHMAAKARIAGTTDNYMDVTSLRTRRPPV
ncbi:MAG: hypothetical protein M3171_05280 [Actinomycetota bacterium]|nr:hypothetical protein [Actinomycetota bacterium]